jgi:2-dehydropantoate 2-reductase
MSEPARLRIAVFGAGSIGCHLGGSLATLADVTLIGRPAAMATVAEAGLTLTGPRPPRHVDPALLTLATSPAAAGPADIVLLTVKSGDTATAAAALAPHLRADAVVISFQNGLHNPEVIRSALPGHAVLAGMVPYNVLQTVPGTFHQGTGGELMLDDTAAAEPFVAVARQAGLRVRPRTDMVAVQYAKLLMNLNNAVNALSGLPLRDELAQRPYRLCLARCQREALAALRAAGVRPARLGPTRPALTPYLLRLPDRLFTRVAAASLRIDAHARSSMWEDLQRGRPTEIDSLQGEIVALATAHGLPAPANARLAALVRQAEAAGAGQARRWSGPDLLAALRGAAR